MNSGEDTKKRPTENSVETTENLHDHNGGEDNDSTRSLTMPSQNNHGITVDDEELHTSMVASTGWKWVMDDMWRAQQMTLSPGEAFLMSCNTFLRFVKQNPKLYECLLTFPIDERSSNGNVGPNAALEYLTQLASNAFQNVGQPSENAVGFSRMIWATLLGLANEIIKHKASGTPYPNPRDLVDTHIRPKCRLIL